MAIKRWQEENIIFEKTIGSYSKEVIE